MLMLLESLDRDAWTPTLLLDDAPGTEPLRHRAAALEVPVRLVPPMPLGLSGARAVPGMARMLRRRRPAVFHAHMSSPVAAKYALAAAVLARVPAVLGTVQVGEFEPPDRSTYWQLRALAHGVDRYLAVSRDIAEELVGRLDWPAKRIEVVYNAVDLGRFEAPAPPGMREELGGGEGRPLVLTPARLDEQKGHRVLLEAVARVPGATFVLAGDGPERPRLEELAERLGVAGRVHFLGHRSDVPQLLAACDVFALPSLYEGSSLAVLEAMAAEIPVVSSAVGGTDELIEDGRSGLLVPPGDSAALAAALKRLLGDPELRQTFAARARERVERDLSRQRMARRVTEVYEELLGDAPPTPADAEQLPESRRNPFLRRLDWRFLVPGGELLHSWRVPRIAGPRRLRRRLEADGFSDVKVYWTGPLPHRQPQFWLPVESSEAVEYLLASRGASSPTGKLLRAVWRFANRAGVLAPLHAVARAPGEAGIDDAPLPPSASLLLLTGGHRSINKAVGLAFEEGEAKPAMAVKFARVAEAEPGLEREARVLGRLGEEHPDLAGVPRLLGQGRRAGRLAVAEEAIEGGSMLHALTDENFGEMATRVTDLLIALASVEPPGPDPSWRERLVEQPLSWFEHRFGPVLDSAALAQVRTLLGGLGDPPAACEHRDCAPWNVLLTPSGEPALLDWESAEPDGLAGIDLVYFLANCAFVLDNAIESETTRQSYARLLDSATARGRVAAAAFERYSRALGVDGEDLRRLRLLCWVVHSRSDYAHLELEVRGGPGPEALRRAPFLGLIEAELERS
jgi:glycosyltransferase involved in cell wall biosynthesis